MTNKTIQLTAAQAIVRFLVNQFILIDGTSTPYFAGIWAIFGHGNVAGLGEALYDYRNQLPTFRAHNEQGMAHAAIAFAKACRRRRAMVCTTSIGPGATNMVTAAALAHVNRLPVLFLPGDVFANRAPDPVLQQVEDFSDGTVSANDCFRPVSRYFDRITRSEQLIDALPRIMFTLLDPNSCGPVTLALCQDVQAEKFEFPERLFDETEHIIRRPRPDSKTLDRLVDKISDANAPIIVAGGGVHYSGAAELLAELSSRVGIPVVESQAGKGAMLANHPLNLGGVGVTGTSAANNAIGKSDLIVGIGTRLQDFTTGSRKLVGRTDQHLVQINVSTWDAHKQFATAIIADAAETIEALLPRFEGVITKSAWTEACTKSATDWHAYTARETAATNRSLPSDAEIIGAVQRVADPDSIVVAAAGGLPGELHKHWQVQDVGTYHVEYGYSCMGYEIAGALGVKMANPNREVYVLLGDGSYLMLNSEIATSRTLELKLTIVLLDNGGFGCINRLQTSVGSPEFNNLLGSKAGWEGIDFAAHAASLGAVVHVAEDVAEVERALKRAKQLSGTQLIIIRTDPTLSSIEGGHWWNVPVPMVSKHESVRAAAKTYEAARKTKDA